MKKNNQSIDFIKDSAFKQVIVWLVMLALYSSYPVQMFPVIAIFENMLFSMKTRYLEIKRSIVRITIVLFTILVAITIPYFGLFMSLIGSFGSSLLAFILPTIFHLKLFWGHHHPLRLIINIVIIIFGVIASAISTTITVIELWNVMTNK